MKAQVFPRPKPRTLVRGSGLTFTVGNKLFIWLLVLFSNITVTFEDEFGKRIQSLALIKDSKVNVIPHYIYPKTEESQSNPPETLKHEHLNNKFNLLFFGFVTPYKGTKELVEIATTTDWPKDVHLTIAGGESPSAGTVEYFNEVSKLAYTNPNITVTGFVPEEDISKHFNNSDLVILPYTTLIGSSGPMSMAISYHKPFIISDALSPYTYTSDFNEILMKLNIDRELLTFKLEKDSVINKINEFKDNTDKLQQLTKLSANLIESRGINVIAKRYEKLLNRIN